MRPERFELPTFWFVARRSIQLSYERISFTKFYHAVLVPAELLATSLVSAAGGLYPTELRAPRCERNSTMSNTARLDAVRCAY